MYMMFRQRSRPVSKESDDEKSDGDLVVDDANDVSIIRLATNSIRIVFIAIHTSIVILAE
jgi:hypothetical protein